MKFKLNIQENGPIITPSEGNTDDNKPSISFKKIDGKNYTDLNNWKTDAKKLPLKPEIKKIPQLDNVWIARIGTIISGSFDENKNRGFIVDLRS